VRPLMIVGCHSMLMPQLAHRALIAILLAKRLDVPISNLMPSL
jgi:hypothetical protein